MAGEKEQYNNLFHVKLKYVKLGYHYMVSNAMYLLLVPLIAMNLTHLSSHTTIEELIKLWNIHLMSNLATTCTCLTSLVFIATLYFMSQPTKVYLVDFSCYKPQPSHMLTKERYMQLCKESNHFTNESLNFFKRILEKSAYGQMTYIPTSLMKVPWNQSMKESWKETEMVMFGAIDELLSKTGVYPKDIGILVVNSSLFNPTPSLSARIVNHYKLRGNILSYNLGGMGCSASLISIDLAKNILQTQRNTYALVISTENMTHNWYTGNDRSLLVTNCLFRMGAAAILLSNRSIDGWRSKYQLKHVVRTHKGADDMAYNCVMQREDEHNLVGVSLSKDLMKIAGEALKANITTLGPLVLPLSEQLLFLFTLVARKLLKKKDVKPYVPDFKLAFEHFCIHAGGRGVLDEIEKNLDLTEWHMEPSRMTLYRFGNTSSSSLWYELAYSEAKGRIKRGDRIWQIGFGSGFKCNSVVWSALRTINPAKEKNPWVGEIDKFPVHVPKVAPIVY